MKRLFIAGLIFIAVFQLSSAVFACEMHFHLISPDGGVQEISPDKSAVISQGEMYTLEVEFIEDHKRCVTPPEETVYLIQEEKWKASKDYLPLQLIEQKEWVNGPDSSSALVQDLAFTALQKGDWDLEIIRDCPKGGYDEFLTFHVQ